ncbi:MAG: dihydroorotate dehydrogenase electron transfer subunit [candidate division Zixibacteria bacterium]|nr:dihydroorotate dehydrogenase electron transfer subunit [candidate division Zixibacteria bacterium]
MKKLATTTVSVTARRDLRNDYYSLTFGPYPRVTKCRPGQFVHIRLPETDILFRRAMSIASVDTDRREIEIIFKVVGRGTTVLSRYRKGDQVDLLGPLGNTFSLPKKSERALLLGGGVGYPPLLYMATHMVRSGFDPKSIEFFYGGRSDRDILDRTRIKKLGVNFHPVTEDGSFGQKGLITHAVESFIQGQKKDRMRIFACGPEPMLKAVDDLGLREGINGELSLEAPMPCGIGVCLGCVVPLKQGGHARVCADGPVFAIGEVIL